MEKLFADIPEAVHESGELSARIAFELSELGYQFPRYPVRPGETESSYLRELTEAGAHWRYGHYSGAVRKQLGSAVKFGRLAEGAADIYPRLGPTSEWDVAAGCAVVTAAGGKVTDADGRPLRFGERTDGFIMPAFIAWGDPSAV